jgi:DNA-binding NarL/FixJ family response regulator
MTALANGGPAQTRDMTGALEIPRTLNRLTDDGPLREAFEAYGTFLVTSLHRLAGAAAPDTAGRLTAAPPDSILSRLSPRERDVLALMAQGLGNSAIAAELFISDGGVHKHIRNIFAKLGLAPDDRTDRRVTAVLRYLRETARAGA